MKIKKATLKDLPEINKLLNSYGLALMDNSYFNHRDVCLIVVKDGTVIGLVWSGLMRKNKAAYIDYFTVDAKYKKEGIGNLLALAMLAELKKRHVETAFGIIFRDKWHDASAVNSLKLGMYTKTEPATYVYGFVDHSVKEVLNINQEAQLNGQ